MIVCQIFDSIDSKSSKKCSLQVFTYRSAVKFRRGQYEESMGLGYTIHNVILVRVRLYYSINADNHFVP